MEKHCYFINIKRQNNCRIRHNMQKSRHTNLDSGKIRSNILEFMNFFRTDVICMRNVLKYHSAKDPGKVDSPFEVRFDMNASRKRKNTKPKGFFEKLKEQRNQRKADRAKQTDSKTDI